MKPPFPKVGERRLFVSVKVTSIKRTKTENWCEFQPTIWKKMLIEKNSPTIMVKEK
jgi:hypothetical protein